MSLIIKHQENGKLEREKKVKENLHSSVSKTFLITFLCCSHSHPHYMSSKKWHHYIIKRSFFHLIIFIQLCVRDHKWIFISWLRDLISLKTHSLQKYTRERKVNEVKKLSAMDWYTSFNVYATLKFCRLL